MKKIIVILFSLICLVAYPQRKNEYGQKMVKNVTVNEYMGGYAGMARRYEFEYDENNRSTSSKLYIKQKNSNDFGLYETYVLKNKELIHSEIDWVKNKLIKDEKQYILNDKSHLIQIIQIFPGEKEVWNYYYDKDASIYDENLVAIEYIETDRNGNFFTWASGKKGKPLMDKVTYDKPKSQCYSYEPLNDTNIMLEDIIMSSRNNILRLSTWVPKYNPYIPVSFMSSNGEESIKIEYYYNENESISKIILYELKTEGYKIMRKIEIQYLY